MADVQIFFDTALNRLREQVNKTLFAYGLQEVGPINSYKELYSGAKRNCPVNEEMFADLKAKWVLPYKENREPETPIPFEFLSYEELFKQTQDLCRVLSPWDILTPMFEKFLPVVNKWEQMYNDLQKFQAAYMPYIMDYNLHIKAGEAINIRQFERDRKNILSQIKRCLYIQVEVKSGKIVGVWAKVKTKRFPLPHILLDIFRKEVNLKFNGDCNIKYSGGQEYKHLYECIVSIAESFGGFYDAVNGEERNTFKGREIERLYHLYMWYKKYKNEWKILKVEFPELVETLLGFHIPGGTEFRYKTKPKWDTGIKVATL